MSAPVLPPGETGNIEGDVYIYIDNSNLWLQGQRTYAEKHKMAAASDPRWRFDAGILKRILAANCSLRPDEQQFHTTVTLYGSTPPPVDTVWRAIESCNVNVQTFERSFHTRREKKVDSQIVANSVLAAGLAAAKGTPSEFVIVSGDADIHSAVETIAGPDLKFHVHVWSWANGLASEYRRQSNPLVHVHLLDPYLEQIGFHNNDWRGDIKDIPVHSAVVLDPEPKAWVMDEFANRYSPKFPFCRYKVEAKRDGASSCDVVIIHALASSNTMTPAALEDFFQLCKREFSKGGLEVLPFLQYKQQHLTGNPTAKVAISNRFRELPDDDPGDVPDDNNPDVDEDENLRDDKASTSTTETPFQTVDRTTTRQKERARRHETKAEKRCDMRLYCQHGLACTYGHTDAERQHFQAYGPKRARKTKLCRYAGTCTRGARCGFAHGEGELFCPTCGRTGEHDMRECPDSSRNAYKR